MEQVKSNLSKIGYEIPVNLQVSADNGYSTDMNTEYLEQEELDGHISSRKLSRQEKNIIQQKNHSPKIISIIIQNRNLFLSIRTTTIQTTRIRIQKQTKNHILDKRMQKLPHTRILHKKPKIQNN